MRKTYSPELKAKVVREVLKEEKSISQIAAAYEVHPNLVTQWRDAFGDVPFKPYEDWSGYSAANRKVTGQGRKQPMNKRNRSYMPK